MGIPVQSADITFLDPLTLAQLDTIRDNLNIPPTTIIQVSDSAANVDVRRLSYSAATGKVVLRPAAP